MLTNSVDLSLSFLPDDDSPKKLYISGEVGNPDIPGATCRLKTMLDHNCSTGRCSLFD
jgi:hypothetical protein